MRTSGCPSSSSQKRTAEDFSSLSDWDAMMFIKNASSMTDGLMNDLTDKYGQICKLAIIRNPSFKFRKKLPTYEDRDEDEPAAPATAASGGDDATTASITSPASSSSPSSSSSALSSSSSATDSTAASGIAVVTSSDSALSLDIRLPIKQGGGKISLSLPNELITKLSSHGGATPCNAAATSSGSDAAVLKGAGATSDTVESVEQISLLYAQKRQQIDQQIQAFMSRKEVEEERRHLSPRPSSRDNRSGETEGKTRSASTSSTSSSSSSSRVPLHVRPAIPKLDLFPDGGIQGQKLMGTSRSPTKLQQLRRFQQDVVDWRLQERIYYKLKQARNIDGEEKMEKLNVVDGKMKQIEDNIKEMAVRGSLENTKCIAEEGREDTQTTAGAETRPPLTIIKSSPSSSPSTAVVAAPAAVLPPLGHRVRSASQPLSSSPSSSTPSAFRALHLLSKGAPAGPASSKAAPLTGPRTPAEFRDKMETHLTDLSPMGRGLTLGQKFVLRTKEILESRCDSDGEEEDDHEADEQKMEHVHEESNEEGERTVVGQGVGVNGQTGASDAGASPAVAPSSAHQGRPAPGVASKGVKYRRHLSDHVFVTKDIVRGDYSRYSRPTGGDGIAELDQNARILEDNQNMSGTRDFDAFLLSQIGMKQKQIQLELAKKLRHEARERKIRDEQTKEHVAIIVQRTKDRQQRLEAHKQEEENLLKLPLKQRMQQLTLAGRGYAGLSQQVSNPQLQQQQGGQRPHAPVGLSRTGALNPLPSDLQKLARRNRSPITSRREWQEETSARGAHKGQGTPAATTVTPTSSSTSSSSSSSSSSPPSSSSSAWATEDVEESDTSADEDGSLLEPSPTMGYGWAMSSNLSLTPREIFPTIEKVMRDRRAKMAAEEEERQRKERQHLGIKEMQPPYVNADGITTDELLSSRFGPQFSKKEAGKLAHLLMHQEIMLLSKIIAKKRKDFLLRNTYFLWRDAFLDVVQYRSVAEERDFRLVQDLRARKFDKRCLLNAAMKSWVQNWRNARLSEQNAIKIIQRGWRKVLARKREKDRLAAVVIQRAWRRYHAVISWVSLKEELVMQQKGYAHFRVRCKRDIIWLWKDRITLLLRWRKKMARKITTWSREALHLHIRKPFPAKMWFSREGKYVMAREYYKHRLRVVMFVKWLLFMMNESDLIPEQRRVWKYRLLLLGNKY